VPFFVIEVVVSIAYAFASLMIEWSGVALVVCGLAGALLRLRYDRESAIILGSLAAGLIFAIDSVLIGFAIAADLRVGVDDPDSPYLPVLVAVVAWLVHLPMGYWAVRLGIKALEAWVTRRARRKGQGEGATNRAHTESNP
jgi:hypothetical protein